MLFGDASAVQLTPPGQHVQLIMRPTAGQLASALSAQPVDGFYDGAYRLYQEVGPAAAPVSLHRADWR